MYALRGISRIALVAASGFALCVARPVSAEGAAALKILPQPGKSICQSSSPKIGEATTKVELCVVGGNFSHDTYILNLDRKAVLKGIDDETSNGLVATYQGEKISLTCVPQNEAPADVSPEKVAIYQKMKNISAEEARKMVILMETVEVGRLCTARLGAATLMEVQVSFE